MRASNYIIAIIFIVSIYTMSKFSGCKSNDGIIDITESISTESSDTRCISELQNLLCDANAYLILIANSAALPSQTCPTITLNGNINSGELKIDYSQIPCINLSDSIRRSGSYKIIYTIDTLQNKDSIHATFQFTNYRIYKTATSFDTNSYINVTGSNELVSSRVDNNNFKSFITSNNTLFSQNSYKTLQLNLNYNSYISNPAISDDDIYYIYGFGQVFNQKDSSTFECQFPEGNPLTMFVNCGYPVKGSFQLSSSKEKTTYIDFYRLNASCDDEVTIAKGTLIEYIFLNQTDF
jgi:hypothetical protein